MMRRIVVDAARARSADKRGGGAVKVDLDDSVDVASRPEPELISLDDRRWLASTSAAVLKISPESVMRDWKIARAMLMREMSGAEQAKPGQLNEPRSPTDPRGVVQVPACASHVHDSVGWMKGGQRQIRFYCEHCFSKGSAAACRCGEARGE